MGEMTTDPITEGAERFVRRIHAEHGAALYGWARQRMADERDAEEVVAEALVKAWRNHDQFDPERGSERAWIFGIVRNTAVDHHRSSQRHLRLVDGREVPEIPEDDAGIQRVAEASVIAEALAVLPEHHRSVIIESFFAGRTSTQIAQRLGIPPGTVKSRLYYGLRTLRAALEERGVLR